MDTKIVKFDDTEIEEYEFHQDIDNNEIVVSNKFPFDKQDLKYFIGQEDNKVTRPLCIFFPDMSTCKRYSDKSKCIYFMIKDEKN